jgi:hypothetical protein
MCMTENSMRLSTMNARKNHIAMIVIYSGGKLLSRASSMESLPNLRKAIVWSSVTLEFLNLVTAHQGQHKIPRLWNKSMSQPSE